MAKGNVFEESDFVYVQDAEGNVKADAVPKSWIGTDLLPEGYKRAPAKAVEAADTNPVVDPPAGETPPV